MLATVPRSMPHVGDYRYRLSSTGANSATHGSCEICNTHCSEVFMQVEERFYVVELGLEGWTQHGCNTYFGHEACLRSRRRP